MPGSGSLAATRPAFSRPRVEDARCAQGDLKRIAAIVAEEEAVEVVVGLPRSLSGGEGPAAESLRFAVRLAARVAPVPVDSSMSV